NPARDGRRRCPAGVSRRVRARSRRRATLDCGEDVFLPGTDLRRAAPDTPTPARRRPAAASSATPDAEGIALHHPPPLLNPHDLIRGDVVEGLLESRRPSDLQVVGLIS